MTNSVGPLAIMLLLLSPTLVQAGMLPSFDEETNAWRATHVVVASEGARVDGALVVLESWRGDLRPGDALNVPDLAEFEEEEARTIVDDIWGRTQGPRVSVSGARMILFLIKGEQQRAGKAEVAWRSASEWGGMKVSAAWVEADKVYAFVQVVNPGGQLLVEVGYEAPMRRTVSDLLTRRDGLERAVALVDPMQRAAALETFARDEHRLVSTAAFRRLRDCGESALPILRRLVSEASGGSRSEAIEALARAGGAKAAADLVVILEEGLEFWRTRAPGLSANWWNGGSDMELLRNRYIDLHDTLELLTPLCYAGCERVVTMTRELWGSNPVLNQIGNSQMVEACDQVLRALREGPREVSPPQARPEVVVVPTPPLEEIPLTTRDDEERLKELEAALDRDLAAEHDHLFALVPVRGAPVQADADGTLAEAIRAAVKIDYKEQDALDLYLREFASESALPEHFDLVRRRLAPNLDLFAPALAAARVTEAFRVEDHWRTVAVDAGRDASHYWNIFGIRAAHMLEALHARQRGEGGRAARLAVDLWCFEEGLGRDERLAVEFRIYNDGRWRAAWLLSVIVPTLDPPALTALESELAGMEVRLPSLPREVRRIRLAWECFLRSWYRSDSKTRWWGPLDHVSPQALLSDRRLATLRREWESFTHVFRELEAASTGEPTERARATIAATPPATREEWMPRRSRPSADWLRDFVVWEVDGYLIDLSRLRALRLLAAGRRHFLEHGRWPASVREALGREPGVGELDPFVGTHLRFASSPTGPLSVTVFTSVGRRGKDLTLTVPLPK